MVVGPQDFSCSLEETLSMLHSIVAPEKAMSHALLAGFTAVVASIAVADELQSDEAVTRASEAAALLGGADCRAAGGAHAGVGA